MPHDYQGMREIPVDPRFIEKITRSSQMTTEQGSDFLKGWGGPSQYAMFASMPVEDRLVYAAILDGNSTQNAIEIATGLKPAQVSRGLTSLQGKGAITLETVVV